MKKYSVMILIAALVITVSLLTSCIPSEYTKGVMLHTDYPIEDFPIMEDAVVFYCDNDEDSFTIKYGTDENVNAVTHFYQKLFETNEITLSGENETKSRYTAEGIYKNYSFSIKAYIAADENEKRVYSTVVKVQLENCEHIIETQKKLVGFWRQHSYEDNTGKKETTFYEGTGYEFYADGSFNAYLNFEFGYSGTWVVVNESAISVTIPPNNSRKLTISFDKRDNKNYLLLETSVGNFELFKDFSNGFTKEESTYDDTTIPTSKLTDKQLSKEIADITWYFIKYVDKDGENHNNLYSDWVSFKTEGTFEDYSSFEYIMGYWNVSDGKLYRKYSNGVSSDIIIDIQTIDEAKHLYLYSSRYPGAYWHYSDVPTETYNSSNGPIKYTSDDVVTKALSGRVFKDYLYINSNGSQEDMSENIMTFNADGTMENYYYGQTVTGSWKYEDGYLELEMDNGQSYKYEAYVEYQLNAGVYYLIIVDQDELEGCFWAFKTQ